jgi:hypothetical protein
MQSNAMPQRESLILVTIRPGPRGLPELFKLPLLCAQACFV